jgi:hypothetical protein
MGFPDAQFSVSLRLVEKVPAAVISKTVNSVTHSIRAYVVRPAKRKQAFKKEGGQALENQSVDPRLDGGRTVEWALA